MTFPSARGDTDAATENVSYRGLFLATSLSLPKRQLLRVRLTLPDAPERLEANVVVASSRPGGVGVSFFGLDGAPRIRWEKFVESVRDGQSASETKVLAAGETSGIARRRGAEELVVAVASVPAFERLSRDLERGALLVQGGKALDVDAPVALRVVHPVTQGAFVVNGVVQRLLAGGGLSVRTSMDTGTRARLTDFLHASWEDASVDVVEFESIPPPVPSQQMSTRA